MNRFIKSMATAALGIVGTCAGSNSLAWSQNFWQDYVRDQGTVYSPADPFVRGAVYRDHIGHSGLYYNCDRQEDLRFSPYILWTARPCDDLLSVRRNVGEFVESKNDAICRWKRGSGRVARVGNYPPGAGYGESAVAAGYADDSKDVKSQSEKKPSEVKKKDDPTQELEKLPERSVSEKENPAKEKPATQTPPADPSDLLEEVPSLDLSPPANTDNSQTQGRRFPATPVVAPRSQSTERRRSQLAPGDQADWRTPPPVPASSGYAVLDLPPINHLKPVPR